MARLYRRRDNPGGNYFIDYTDAEGLRHRRTLETSLLREAKERRDAIVAGTAELKWGKRRKDCKVADFWKLHDTDPGLDTGEYIDWARRHKSKNSIARERFNWAQLLEFASPTTLGAVTSKTVEAFKTHLTDKRRQEPRTVNDAIVRLQALWNHARATLDVYAKQNPFADIKRLPVDEKPIRFFTQEQIEAVMREAGELSEDIYLFCALCIFAGLRTAEAVNAQWSWFDLKGGVVTVQSATGKFSTKNRKTRTVPLHARLRAIVEPFAAESGYLINPEKTEPGKWRIRYEPKRGFAYVVRAAGVAWATPHNCRHTFASRLVQEGVSIYKVSQWLGHSSVKTTEKAYAGLAPRDEDIDRL